MTERKVPMRMCVGCREMKPKRELTRVVKPAEGEAYIDPKGKAPGRGAYLCVQEECLKKARKTRALERALECTIGDAVYEAMAARLTELKAEGIAE